MEDGGRWSKWTDIDGHIWYTPLDDTAKRLFRHDGEALQNEALTVVKDNERPPDTHKSTIVGIENDPGKYDLFKAIKRGPFRQYTIQLSLLFDEWSKEIKKKNKKGELVQKRVLDFVSFKSLMSELSPFLGNAGCDISLNLWDVFKRKDYISKKSFILGMVSLDPATPHKTNEMLGTDIRSGVPQYKIDELLSVRLEYIFRFYDVDNDGYLNEKELSEMLYKLDYLNRLRKNSSNKKSFWESLPKLEITLDDPDDPRIFYEPDAKGGYEEANRVDYLALMNGDLSQFEDSKRTERSFQPFTQEFLINRLVQLGEIQPTNDFVQSFLDVRENESSEGTSSHPSRVVFKEPIHGESQGSNRKSYIVSRDEPSTENTEEEVGSKDNGLKKEFKGFGNLNIMNLFETCRFTDGHISSTSGNSPAQLGTTRTESVHGMPNTLDPHVLPADDDHDYDLIRHSQLWELNDMPFQGCSIGRTTFKLNVSDGDASSFNNIQSDYMTTTNPESMSPTGLTHREQLQVSNGSLPAGDVLQGKLHRDCLIGSVGGLNLDETAYSDVGTVREGGVLDDEAGEPESHNRSTFIENQRSGSMNMESRRDSSLDNVLWDSKSLDSQQIIYDEIDWIALSQTNAPPPDYTIPASDTTTGMNDTSRITDMINTNTVLLASDELSPMYMNGGSNRIEMVGSNRTLDFKSALGPDEDNIHKKLADVMDRRPGTRDNDFGNNYGFSGDLGGKCQSNVEFELLNTPVVMDDADQGMVTSMIAVQGSTAILGGGEGFGDHPNFSRIDSCLDADAEMGINQFIRDSAPINGVFMGDMVMGDSIGGMDTKGMCTAMSTRAIDMGTAIDTGGMDTSKYTDDAPIPSLSQSPHYQLTSKYKKDSRMSPVPLPIHLPSDIYDSDGCHCESSSAMDREGGPVKLGAPKRGYPAFGGGEYRWDAEMSIRSYDMSLANTSLRCEQGSVIDNTIRAEISLPSSCCSDEPRQQTPIKPKHVDVWRKFKRIFRRDGKHCSVPEESHRVQARELLALYQYRFNRTAFCDAVARGHIYGTEHLFRMSYSLKAHFDNNNRVSHEVDRERAPEHIESEVNETAERGVCECINAYTKGYKNRFHEICPICKTQAKHGIKDDASKGGSRYIYVDAGGRGNLITSPPSKRQSPKLTDQKISHSMMPQPDNSRIHHITDETSDSVEIASSPSSLERKYRSYMGMDSFRSSNSIYTDTCLMQPIYDGPNAGAKFSPVGDHKHQHVYLRDTTNHMATFNSCSDIGQDNNVDGANADYTNQQMLDWCYSAGSTSGLVDRSYIYSSPEWGGITKRNAGSYKATIPHRGTENEERYRVSSDYEIPKSGYTNADDIYSNRPDIPPIPMCNLSGASDQSSVYQTNMSSPGRVLATMSINISRSGIYNTKGNSVCDSDGDGDIVIVDIVDRHLDLLVHRSNYRSLFSEISNQVVIRGGLSDNHWNIRRNVDEYDRKMLYSQLVTHPPAYVFQKIISEIYPFVTSRNPSDTLVQILRNMSLALISRSFASIRSQEDPMFTHVRCPKKRKCYQYGFQYDASTVFQFSEHHGMIDNIRMLQENTNEYMFYIGRVENIFVFQGNCTVVENGDVDKAAASVAAGFLLLVIMKCIHQDKVHILRCGSLLSALSIFISTHMESLGGDIGSELLSLANGLPHGLIVDGYDGVTVYPATHMLNNEAITNPRYLREIDESQIDWQRVLPQKHSNSISRLIRGIARSRAVPTAKRKSKITSKLLRCVCDSEKMRSPVGQ